MISTTYFVFNRIMVTFFKIKCMFLNFDVFIFVFILLSRTMKDAVLPALTSVSLRSWD